MSLNSLGIQLAAFCEVPQRQVLQDSAESLRCHLIVHPTLLRGLELCATLSRNLPDRLFDLAPTRALWCWHYLLLGR